MELSEQAARSAVKRYIRFMRLKASATQLREALRDYDRSQGYNRRESSKSSMAYDYAIYPWTSDTLTAISDDRFDRLVSQLGTRLP